MDDKANIRSSVTRSGICKAWLIEPSSPPEDRVKVSATAGGITGGVGGAVLSKSILTDLSLLLVSRLVSCTRLGRV